MARKDSKGRNLHTGESQRKDGTYMYRYTDERTRKRQTVYAKDLPELRAREKQIARDADDGILTDNRIKKLTVNDLFNTYMKTKSIAESSRRLYLVTWERHLKDSIGQTRVQQLQPSDVKAFYTQLSNEGYSHSTIRLIHMILLPTLEMALDDDIIRKNPAKKALSSNYGTAAKEKDVLTAAQQDALIKFMRESNVYNVYVPMITVMLETGVRCGELVGLTWNDVDMKKKELSINHQLGYQNFDDGKGCHFFVTAPKTDAGTRTIPLTQKACKAFADQQEQNILLNRHNIREIDGYSDFIFLTRTGNVLTHNTINKAICNAVDAYNRKETVAAEKEHRKPEFLPKLSAHSFRHTACTNMAKRGVNIKTLQYIMGHADCSITMDVYNHATGTDDAREEMQKMENGVNLV